MGRPSVLASCTFLHEMDFSPFGFFEYFVVKNPNSLAGRLTNHRGFRWHAINPIFRVPPCCPWSRIPRRAQLKKLPPDDALWVPDDTCSNPDYSNFTQQRDLG